MVLAGLFAMVWSIIRACVQSVTLDEADTYFWFVAGSRVFFPFPNNHVLNSLLIWTSTHLFGLSSFTLRLPALLGAGIYIFTCYFLCRALIDRFSLQLAVFICLVYNPFILDFMVAARGYSMANAFLLAAIAIPVWHNMERGPSLGRSCALASIALGLSLSANFSFALVDLSAWLAILIWALAESKRPSLGRIVGLLVLPGLFLVLLICGYPLTHMKKGDLFYGAQSFHEMVRSLIDATLYHLNPRVGGSLFKVTQFVYPWLLPALGVLCVCQILFALFDGSWRRLGRARWLAAAPGGIAGLSVLMHLLAFRVYNLPLPKSRTGIFLLPLCTLCAGLLAAGPVRSSVSRLLRSGITSAFVCLAFYFVLCLRLTYFKEYEYDRDVKDVYRVLARLNHTYGVTEVTSTGVYASALNFYRVASAKETFTEFKATVGGFPVGKSLYVMHGPFERPFIEREKLVIIYRGKSGEVVVTVPPNGPIPPVVIDR
jgi:hypothetical protein